MTRVSDARLHSFTNEIGWKANIRATETSLAGEWAPRLDELFEVCGRAARWSSDALGTIEYPENGERWLAAFKTFIDGKKIWRLYERVHLNPERPTFQIARRSSDLNWEPMGYFNKWPTRPPNNEAAMES